MSNRDFVIKERGRLGESYVCDYLKEKGYKIVVTNFSSRYGEIDIIAQNEKFIVFVEVKTRVSNSFTGGFESITKPKINKITKTIYCYLSKNKTDLQPRIDCAGVLVNPNDNSLIRINYIENAVEQEGVYEPF